MSAVEAFALDGLSREQWLDARRTGIGSSDAPAICNVDRFRSPFVVYLDKIGELGEEDESPAMHWGNRLEQVIADEFAERTLYDLSKPAAMYRHPEHSFMLASPDREIAEPDGPPFSIVEIKSSRLSEDWTDGPPERTLIQLQHQLAVTGFDHGFVAVLLHGRDYAHWRIERDDELIALLVKIEAEFWERVETRNPPPVDGHPSTTSALNELYALSSLGSELDLPEDARRLHVELTLAKQMQADAKTDADALTNEFKVLLGDSEIGLIDGEPAVTWKAGKPKDHVHNCPDCAHAPEGPPSRTFLVK